MSRAGKSPEPCGKCSRASARLPSWPLLMQPLNEQAETCARNTGRVHRAAQATPVGTPRKARSGGIVRQTGFSPHPGLTFPICNLGMTEFCCWLTARHRAWPLVNADQLLSERGLFRVEREGILILLSELSPSFAKCSWNQGKDHHCGFKWRVLRGWDGRSWASHDLFIDSVQAFRTGRVVFVFFHKLTSSRSNPPALGTGRTQGWDGGVGVGGERPDQTG